MKTDNQPATKKDLKLLQRDLKNLGSSTKAEFKKLATKEELKKLATKEELKKFATKKDLKKDIKDLRVELVGKMVDLEFKFENRFEGVDQKIDEKFSQVLTGQDKLMGMLKTWREEQIFQGTQVGRHTERIGKLEEKVGIKANYEL